MQFKGWLNYNVKDQGNGYIWRREKWYKGSFKGAGSYSFPKGGGGYVGVFTLR